MEDARIHELIDRAIKREQEAYEFYRGLVEKVADENAQETISGIAEEEKGHEKFLIKYRKENWSPKNLRMSDVAYYKIAEYQKEPEITQHMTSAEVYLVASHRELRSFHFYSELAALHPEGEIRELLLKMANEELKHKEKMEYLYANTAFPQTDGG
jgi:rubrerythrin